MYWSEYKDSNLGPLAPKASALPGCATLRFWCRLSESNGRPTDYKSVALPAELSRQI